MIGTINSFVSSVISTVKSPFVGAKSVSKKVVSRKASRSRKRK